MASVARSRELAVVIAWAGTTSGRWVLNVGRKVTRAIPTTSSTAISWFTERTPKAQASGTVSSAAAATRSAAIISGRRRRSRSTQAPTTSANPTYGAVPAAVSSPICIGVAPSRIAAATGIARTVTSLPIAEIA